jgi:hypothetical protein
MALNKSARIGRGDLSMPGSVPAEHETQRSENLCILRPNSSTYECPSLQYIQISISSPTSSDR